jgi:hypothetical protein
LHSGEVAITAAERLLYFPCRRFRLVLVMSNTDCSMFLHTIISMFGALGGVFEFFFRVVASMEESR